MSDGSLRLYPPDGVQLGMVKTTFMRYGKSRPSHVGLPQATHYKPSEPTAKWIKAYPDTWDYVGLDTAQNNHVVLTEALQWHWFRECVKRDPNHPNNAQDNWYYDRAFNSLTDDDLVQTNRFGSETCAVYPTQTNLENEPMRFFTITEGLAVHLILGPEKNVLGRPRWPIRTINAKASLAGTTFEELPWCWFPFMNSTRTPILNDQGKWPNGAPVYREDGYQRFPQFNRSAIAPLLMPNTDVGWIDVDYIQLLDPNKPIPMLFNM